MTTTTATAKLRFIPTEGYRTTVGNVEIRSHFVNGAGWTIQIRRDGTFESAQMHNTELAAVDAINALLAGLTTEQPAPAAAPTVKLTPAAKGTQTKVTDPAHTALVVAELNGRVDRGGQPGQASVTLLNSLARRGYLNLTYQTGRTDSRKVVTGGVLTRAGQIRLAQLTADERAEADKAARLAIVDNIRTAA